VATSKRPATTEPAARQAGQGRQGPGAGTPEKNPRGLRELEGRERSDRWSPPLAEREHGLALVGGGDAPSRKRLQTGPGTLPVPCSDEGPRASG